MIMLTLFVNSYVNGLLGYTVTVTMQHGDFIKQVDTNQESGLSFICNWNIIHTWAFFVAWKMELNSLKGNNINELVIQDFNNPILVFKSCHANTSQDPVSRTSSKRCVLLGRNPYKLTSMVRYNM